MNFLKLFKKGFSSKVFKSAEEAIKDVTSGSRIIVGGFGLCGHPENLIKALAKREDLKDLEVVSDNGGTDDYSIGLLFQKKMVKRIIASFIGNNKAFEKQYLSGELELELTPQGTLAEKLRSGGAGVPGFYTPTGVDTLVEEGGIPIKYRKDGTIEITSLKKETKVIKDKKYVFEESIKGDFAIIKGWKGDTKGNIVFRKTARNFNIDAATAGKVCIAEVEELVNPGDLKPDEIHLPGIFVDRIFKGEVYEKRIEKMVTAESMTSNNDEESLFRNRIAKRAAQELRDGKYYNLGVGIPTIVANYLPKGLNIDFHAENGMIGVGPYPKRVDVDADLINPGKEPVSETKGCVYFKSSDSFGIIRGGHLDATILGGIQVSSSGDLANWIIPGKMVKGMGGAMDLVSGTKVIVCMRHSAKGHPKILEHCTLPLTGKGVVSLLVTELAVFEFTNGNIKLIEIFEDTTLDNVKALTGCKFDIADNLKIIKL